MMVLYKESYNILHSGSLQSGSLDISPLYHLLENSTFDLSSGVHINVLSL